jgi:hypothetical protein
MVTAYIEGPSLQDAVGRWGPMPPDRLRALGAGLAEGLAAIHASGLVHRDLKPANVILPADGPRIIDFGIARAVDATTGLTTTGSVVGTIAYMSPEQIRGEPADPASDVFSLGCVLAYAATGAHPFGEGSAASVIYRIVAGQADLARVPPLLREVLADCLLKDPAKRPPLPVLASALAGGGPAVTGSFSSFWPQSVADAIRRSVPDESAYGAPSAADDAVPEFTPAGYTPTAAAQRPESTRHTSPARRYAPAVSGEAPVYAGPSYAALPPPGHISGVTRPRAGGMAGRRLADAPGDVSAAVTVMIVGAAITATDFVFSLQARTALLHVAQRHPYLRAGEDAKTTAAKIAVYAALPYLLGIFGWLAGTVATARRRPGAPALAAVLFGLDTVLTLLVVFGFPNQRRIDALAVAIWILGLIAVILLRSRNSRSYLDRA